MTSRPSAPTGRATSDEKNIDDTASDAARRILLARIVSLAAVFAGSVVLARALGPDGRGAHAFFVAATILFTAALGFGGATGAYILASREGVRPRDLTVSATWVAAATGSIAALVLVALQAFVGVLPPALAAIPAWPVLFGVAVAGFILNTYQVQLAFAQGRAVGGAILSFGPYTLAAAGYILLLAAGTAGLTSAAWVFAVSPYGLMALAAASRRGLALASVGWLRPCLVARAIRVGLRPYPGELASILHMRGDVVLLGILAPTASVGIYVVAYQSVEPLLVLASASSAAVLSLGHGRVAVERGTVTARLIRETMVMGGVLAAMAAVVAPLFVPLVYGRAFAESVGPLLILLPAVVALSIGRIAAADLTRRNLLGRMAAVSVVALATNVALNLVLIPRLGASGAALASLTSYTTFACLAVLLDKQAGGFAFADLIPRPHDARSVIRGWTSRSR